MKEENKNKEVNLTDKEKFELMHLEWRVRISKLSKMELFSLLDACLDLIREGAKKYPAYYDHSRKLKEDLS